MATFIKVKIKKIDTQLQEMDIPQVGEISDAWMDVEKIVTIWESKDKESDDDCVNITFSNGESMNIYGETMEGFVMRITEL